jgi:hypothetical protein
MKMRPIHPTQLKAKQERLENASDASVSSEDEDRDGADDVAAVTGNATTLFAVPLAKDRAKLWLAKAKKNAEINKPNLLESDREARREQNRRVRVMLDEAKRKEVREAAAVRQLVVQGERKRQRKR